MRGLRGTLKLNREREEDMLDSGRAFQDPYQYFLSTNWVVVLTIRLSICGTIAVVNFYIDIGKKTKRNAAFDRSWTY